MEELGKHAARSVKWTALATATTTTIYFVQLGVLARLLQPEDFGLMAMATFCLGFVQMYLDMGMGAAIIHRKENSAQGLSSLYWLNLAFGLALFALSCLVSPWLAVWYKEPRLHGIVQAIFLNILISPLGTPFQMLLQKELKFNLLAKQEIAVTVVRTLLTVGLAYWLHSVWALVWGQLAFTGLRTALFIGAGWSQWRPQFHFRAADLRGYFNFGLFQMADKTVNYLYSFADQLIIGRICDAGVLGQYNFAYQLASRPVSTVNPVVTKVAFPVFAKIQDDTARLKRGYFRLLRILVRINSPLLVGLAVVAPSLIPLCFGPQWLPSAGLVQIFAIASLIRSIGNPAGSLILAKGRADLSFKWNLVYLAAVLAAVYLASRGGNVKTIALALLALQFLFLFADYFVLIRGLLGPCGWEYAEAVGKPILPAVAMGLLLYYGLGWMQAGVPALIAEIAAGSLLYGAISWWLGREDSLEILALMRK